MMTMTKIDGARDLLTMTMVMTILTMLMVPVLVVMVAPSGECAWLIIREVLVCS